MGVILMIFIAIRPEITLFVSLSNFIGLSLLRFLARLLTQYRAKGALSANAGLKEGS